MKKYFAHSPNEFQKEWEPLSDHLKAVAKTTAAFCSEFGFSDLGYLAGLFHDIGKYQDAFQERLKGAKTPVEHSICGAKEILSLLKGNKKHALDPINAEILAYIIAGHHSGLADAGTTADNFSLPTLQARLNRETGDFSAYKGETDFNHDVQNWLAGFEGYSDKERIFAISILTRMFYSALVDADSLETEKFYKGARNYHHTTFEQLKQSLDEKLKSFNKDNINVINKKRNEIQEMCLNISTAKKGIYSLTVPTGGGKTLSSMVFALNHLLRHGHKRIIYVIPYTSIIEQTARIFKQIFGEDNVLEHHSNFTFEDSDKGDEELTPQSFATENWDAPIVLTTNVQFFESLFSSKRGTSRKVHNIANSVIIFDEAQMVPIDLLAPCMKSVDILTRNFGCTALLMSATCPDYVPFMCKDAKITEINTGYRQHFVDFKRTSSEYVGAKSNEELLELIDPNEQSLIVVNTRRQARDLFNALPDDCNKYHLSTLMYPKDRAETIEKIKVDLAQGSPCTVVSTQLIECGVDLDFATVFRSLAGIDSIVQAGGRCNREGKRERSKVYVFEAENDPKRGDIQIYKNFARSICKNSAHNDILTLENIEKYFAYILDKEEIMPDQKEILKLFKVGTPEFFLDFNFDTCNKVFSYIEQNNKVDIIVPNGDEPKNTLAKINATKTATKSDYRKLAQYTVSIYKHEFLKLQSQGKIEPLGTTDRTFVLTDLNCYTKVGLHIPASATDEIFIF